ncbi:hypothetical protein [Methylobacterium sp. 88A]|uniref:hypothetical protein n=1 Tax=Methylobacterium sp. 88A TaxID=1131813 RepID=UPI000363D769|nr:hypothetical protein [Methylobacterium sp. 88A]
MTAAIGKSARFRNAWSIARHTALTLDLTVECARQFFRAALRKAWADARWVAAPAKPAMGKLLLQRGSHPHPTWLAKVTGKDAKFGLAREFLKGASVYDNGPYLRFEFPLVEGTVLQDDTKDFWVVRDGALVEVSRWNEPEVAAIHARFA